MTRSKATAEPASEVTAVVDDEIAMLERELGEIELLVTQARTEAERHEQKRAQGESKFETVTAGPPDPKAVTEAAVQQIQLTRRAALMGTQVEVLEGKRRVLERYRDSLVKVRDSLPAGVGAPTAPQLEAGLEPGELPPAVSRMVLAGQEDLRREIARTMHDGPAQSLTNIVLQAQIVERLVQKEAPTAQAEVQQLVGMVQQTLDATKSFIFDVRPMVLDDLGLVPTVRRAARDRGQRTGVPVEFESIGADRRVAPELESALFRILDEALAAYLAAGPDSVHLRLDWSERLEARVVARRARSATDSRKDPQPPSGEAVPPALAALMEEQRQVHEAAVEKARVAGLVVLPPAVWKEIQQRAATVGIVAELVDEGSQLRLVVDLGTREG